MRPRSIQGVPGLDSCASPFARLEHFGRMVLQVPKEEADKERDKERTEILAAKPVAQPQKQVSKSKGRRKCVPH